MMSGRQILWVIYRSFRINPQDRAVTDLAKLRSVLLSSSDLQGFKYEWDTMTQNLSEPQFDEILKFYFLLQLDKMPKNSEFGIQYTIWCAKTKAISRTHVEISEFVDTFLESKRETNNRKAILGEALPKLDLKSVGIYKSGTSTRAGEETTTGKGETERLRLTGKSHLQSSVFESRENSTERRKVITNTALVCRNHFKGQCKRGNQCQFHHNEPCRFYMAGTCTNNKCPFPHVDIAAQAALHVEVPAPRKAKTKAQAGDCAPRHGGAMVSCNKGNSQRQPA